MKKLPVRLKVRFDIWAWPIVRRWFAFEVDSEFVRGVEFGRKWYEDELRGQGNASTGRSINLTVKTDYAPWSMCVCGRTFHGGGGCPVHPNTGTFSAGSHPEDA